MSDTTHLNAAVEGADEASARAHARLIKAEQVAHMGAVEAEGDGRPLVSARPVLVLGEGQREQVGFADGGSQGGQHASGVLDCAAFLRGGEVVEL